ncbi:MAG: shikimate dehydrogenase [bacterium]|nr:shikimate dehydrogenase [bacterium]
MKIDTDTQLCGVIGNPVEHSLSPAMHNAAFEAAGLNYAYMAFRVEDVAACLTGMRALPSFKGLSVTIPHKMAVMPHLDEVDALADHVGCVNTITNDEGKLKGTITDGLGTLRAFEAAGVSLDDRNVLFVGSGGAVRAVAFAMAERTQANRITILGRTPARVAAIMDDLHDRSPADVHSGPLDTLAEAMASHDVIVQGTPIGMYPNPGDTPIPKDLLRPDQVVFDMVYRPFKTRLLEEAEDVGCKTIVGLEMLINQAVLQFECWTGKPAPVDAMRESVLAALKQ